MEVKIISDKPNPLLKRREVNFKVDHDKTGSTPPRPEIRKAVANTLKVNSDLVFVKKYESKVGMRSALGVANVYESSEQAKLVEPEYIIKRNIPPDKPEEEKEQK